MGEIVVTDPELLNVARNVRILMVQQDVTGVHLAHILDLKPPSISHKVNGRIAFQADEIPKLAKFFNTTVDALYAADTAQSAPPQKYKNGEETTGHPADAILEKIEKEMENGFPTGVPPAKVEPTEIHNSTIVEMLIDITEDKDQLGKLLKRMFMAKLSGKIEDLGYYLRNNLMLKAIGISKLPYLSDADKMEYVQHFSKVYLEWKENLVTEIDDITEILLSGNTYIEVMSLLAPLPANALSRHLGELVHLNCDPSGLVDLQGAVDAFDRAIETIEEVKKVILKYVRQNR